MKTEKAPITSAVESKIAHLLKVRRGPNSGTQKLFRMSPPYMGYEYIISSAIVVFGEPETYLFPATVGGGIIDWLELPGSIEGSYCPDDAIRILGYTIVS